jgi:hypothetical protein
MNSFFSKVKAEGKYLKLQSSHSTKCFAFAATNIEYYHFSQQSVLQQANSLVAPATGKQQEAGRLGTEHGSRKNCPTSESGKRY